MVWAKDKKIVGWSYFEQEIEVTQYNSCTWKMETYTDTYSPFVSDMSLLFIILLWAFMIVGFYLAITDN